MCRLNHALVLLSLLVATPLVAAQEAARKDDDQKTESSVFDVPLRQAGYLRLQNELQGLFQQQKFAEAEKVCRQILVLAPEQPSAWYNLACAQSRQQETDEAMKSLERAVELGFRDIGQLKTDTDLDALRGSKAFDRLVERAGEPVAPRPADGDQRRVTPNAPQEGIVLVDENNTVWDPRLQLFRSFFQFGAPPTRDADAVRGLAEAGNLINRWWREGTAAGNHGDVYDNHDTDHSNMNYKAFPQLVRVEFSEPARKRSFHHGLQNRFLYNAVTIGNSSTALTGGPIWRSQPRLALTNAQATLSLLAQYASNHVYVYPEHRDHDVGHNGGRGDKEDQQAKGHGDVYPVNTPYLVISQGSSGSDREFLSALAATLAAFRPDVKAELRKRGMIAPTLQMILRRASKPVGSDEDYLTGAAHPTVFDGKQLDVPRMVRLAHEITPQQLPPVVRLRVVEEHKPELGRDYFHARPVGEHLFDSPSAIARVGRSIRNNRRLVVSAEQSEDVNQRPLTYHWVLLRGDAERVQIKQLDEAGKTAEIRVDHHPRRPIAAGNTLESNRVDIGVFVNNGVWYSAPAFITYYFPDNERRVYDEQGRIQVVDYADETVRENYVDPLIVLRKNWRDEFQYGKDGELTGWTRHAGDDSHRFTADGLLVTRLDDQHRPLAARPVQYIVDRGRNGTPTLRWEATGEERTLESTPR